jgi:peptide/nickel transport system permease protein
MDTNIEKIPTTPPDEITWEDDLKKVGLLRRLLRARKWYGADWWFVAISSLAVLFFILVAIFPSWFAPYTPDTLVGPRFLAPNEIPAVSVLIAPSDSTISSLKDLAVDENADRPKVAVVMGASTSGDLNDTAKQIDADLISEGNGLRLRPVIERYDSLDSALQAVADGTDAVAVIESTEFAGVSQNYTSLREAGSLTGEVVSTSTEGFVMGTNDIGQDIYSRLIYGTRIALIIGFSSSLLSLFLGVPLGLLAGFIGGALDRLLSLVMDSLYAFPGLILAIAIAAVLGPSILNIIIAISVLYIPTYYRIVRGQTLTVKEEVYVEAARSIGARRSEILWRYIFPNVIPSVAIIFSVNVADAILTGAGLSFLGLGLPPTIADWGIDLARGQRFIQTAPWMITFPGLAILLVVLAFTLMGEGLTEIFNPKLRDR